MTLYQFGLFLLLVLALLYVQFRHRSVNYPKTRRWKMILFSSGFIFGAGVVTLLGLEYQQVALGRRLAFVVLGGLFCGLMYTFLFPEQMQVLYPNRDEPDDSEQE